MRPADRDPPELIPYASHVAHGTGRTPIGIILFAASHLLLGGFLAFAAYRFGGRAGVWFFEVTVFLAAFAMMLGGASLLMKGQWAWLTSLVSFSWLAVCEAAVAAQATVAILLSMRDASFVRLTQPGIILLCLSAAVFAPCFIMLSYLGSAKARNTFALPPGQTPSLVRLLPRVAVTLLITGIVIGAAIGRLS